MTIQLTVDGRQVEVEREQASLLEVLRDELGVRSPKDGCSPQGQCGCCTVLVDGQPRVSCVTPVRRVAGRSVTTLDGLEEPVRRTWGDSLCSTGGSQCGFCTPGIIVRLEGLRTKGAEADDHAAVDRALAAHLCRCTGWQTIHEAWDLAVPALASQATSASGKEPAADAESDTPKPTALARRDVPAAERRAGLEGRTHQRVGPEVALGAGGFADDTAPLDALVAVPDGAGGWSVAETLGEARTAAGKVQGRRSSVSVEPPLAVPEGDWAVTLATSWVEPAYLEVDASWCVPGGDPVSPLANGGAFGGKVSTPVVAAARELADLQGRAVRVVLAREEAVRMGPKRPPVAGGANPDGSGVLRVVATPGIAEAVASVAPGLSLEEVELPGGLGTSASLRAAGWAEAAILVAAADGSTVVSSPDGSEAEAELVDGTVRVRVRCGDPLDEVVLRSYCIGAAHMALGWVTSEGLAMTPEGEVADLTIRSFGVLRSAEMPHVEVVIDRTGDDEPVNGSDAVFAAVALAAWRHQGLPPVWPTATSLS